ncbi:glycosyl transferase [Tersicoccus solisilvae]|uniref:D-inositol 3-phosphate glycosyltransferase n=1 Tax=Tersicoccus solisilvae TaxID=1882339 RepID=A0ABQ1PBJ6_9MICC|nr:glycosyltransferase family 1 protein [Tersicoccus solisilvae]GGC93392.1 glycosyl transferase [Tersicoccus solisilvae]
MRIAIVAESFLPHMNGVTNSLLHVLEHLARRGDDVLVVAPSGSTVAPYVPDQLAGFLPAPLATVVTEDDGPARVHGFPVHRLPSFALAGYPNVRVAAGTVGRVRRLLADFRPDVVHLASPFVLGWRAVQAANHLGIPTAAVYQTEVPAYAARYGVPWLEPRLWQRVQDIHRAATVTLAPSTFAHDQLLEHGVPRLALWRRGVDTTGFSPSRRDDALRAELAPDGQRLVGYVGRLAAEKQVEDLAVLGDAPGVRLVVVGSGPLKDALREKLPGAWFAGFRSGADLARIVASLDVFVHPGESETFCQTIQEAMASGVPVVATGRGGPLDLVDSSRTGWLYRPGDLTGMRERVLDLVGDDAKRAAFARAAHASVQGRTWPVLCDQLIGHYEDAMAAHRQVRPAAGRSLLRSRRG